MKSFQLSGAMLGLTVLLGACSGETPPTTTPPATTFSLTVNLSGVASAPVTVTDTTTNVQVFSGTLDGGKTFGGLKAGDVFRVEGGAVGGYTGADTQTVTLDASKTVTLAYKAAGSALSGSRIAGKIGGNTLKIAQVVLDASSSPFFGVAPVDDTNSFTLDLSGLTPPAGRLYPLTANCTVTGANSNPGVMVWGDGVLAAYGPQGDLLGTVVEQIVSGVNQPGTDARIMRLYASGDAVFQGVCTTWNGSAQITEDINVSLRAGWNALALTQNGTTYTYRNVGSGARTQLQFTSAAQRVAVSLNPNTLYFTDDGTVTVNAAFTQVGGYSGTVTLRTDDPNLTVEPATVTLPALPTQPQTRSPRLAPLDLSPQSVTQKLTFRYQGGTSLYRNFEVQVLDGQGQQVGSGSGTLSVQRPGINVSTYQSSTQVTPGGTAQLPVQLYATGNFSGQVTVRLEDLPAGVTADTQTVSLSGYNSTYLTLTGGPKLTPGEYQATLVAEGGGRSARAPVTLVIPKPTVSVNIVNPYYAVSVYQGGAGSIDVNVGSNAGFSGSTTLTVTGLPQGVTAPPVNVSVTPGTTTTVKIPLSAATDAPLGTSTVTVSSPDGSGFGASTVPLTVRPGRTAIGTVGGEVARAGDGFWAASSSTYTSTGYRTSLTRYGRDGQVVATAALDASSTLRLVSLAAGEVLATDSSGYAARINDAGDVTRITGFLSYSDAVSRTADAQGRVWFVRRSSSGGQDTAFLAYWDPASGQVTTADTTRSYGSYGGSFAVSPNGQTLVYLSSYGGRAVRIDAATATVTDLNVPSYGQNAALSNAGTVWYTESGQLKRVNADGSVTTFQGTSVDTLPGFDRGDDSVLWGAYSSNILKIDATTGRATTLSLSNVNSALPLSGGGLAVIMSDYEPYSSGPKSYLSVLK